MFLRLLSVAIASSVLLSGGIQQDSKKHQTLSSYVQSLHWDTSKKGTLLVLDPDNVWCSGEANGLGSFDRKLVTLPSVSAIVPNQMVVIDDEHLPEPNLYDGLDRDSKIMFLLATMTPEQARIANTEGISVDDLQGQQRAALQSILPHSIAWDSYNVAQDNIGSGSVSPEQMSKVRLKIVRSLEFQVPVSNGGYMPMRPEQVQIKGEKEVRRRGESSGLATFGAAVKQVVDNKLKPSDLNYDDRSLTVSVTLQGNTTVGQLAASVGSACGKEIFADGRVASLPVQVAGRSASGSDLLKALALAVTGAYRRVGSAYVLASDLEGLGTRQAKLWYWQNGAYAAMQANTAKWKAQIAGSGVLNSIQFDPKDPHTPDGDLAQQLAKWDQSDNPERISPSQLPQEDQAMLATYRNQLPPSVSLDGPNVGLQSTLAYQFILPDGQPLHLEMSNLPTFHDFNKKPESLPEGFAIGQFALPPADGVKHSLMVRIEEPERLDGLLQAAQAHGFTDLWIDTTKPDILSAAAAKGFHVSLAVDPWFARGSVSDPDMDSLGETFGRQAVRARAASNQKPEPALVGANLYSPVDSELGTRWAAIHKLASTQSVEGIVLVDSQPRGYEPSYKASMVLAVSSTAWFGSDFGYSVGLRLQFLRSHGVDPIDIASRQMGLNVDMEQPFFPDGALDSADKTPTPTADALMENSFNEWIGFRAAANKRAIGSLLEALAPLNKPILLTARPVESDANREYQGYSVFPWAPGADLTTAQTSASNPMILFSLSIPGLPTLKPNPSVPVNHTLDKATTPFVVDARGFSAEDVEPQLDVWFVKS